MSKPAKTHNYHSCLDCTGFNLRKAMRAVSQFYDEMLRPVGIRGTQYSLLVALKICGITSVTQLAEHVVMDRTTLTRNLNVLEKQGLVKIVSGADRRTRNVNLTEAGAALLLKAYPLWEQAQAKISDAMGEERLQILMANLVELINATHQK